MSLDKRIPPILYGPAHCFKKPFEDRRFSNKVFLLSVALFVYALIFNACGQIHEERPSGYYIPCDIRWDTLRLFDRKLNEDVRNLSIYQEFTFFYFTEAEIVKFSSLNQMDGDSLFVGIENFTAVIANDITYSDNAMIVTWDDKSMDTLYLNSEFRYKGDTYCKSRIFCRDSKLRIESFYQILKKKRYKPRHERKIPMIDC